MKTPLVILLLVLSGCSLPQQRASAPATPKPSPTVASTPTPERPIILDVIDYTEEFSSNEVAASAKYKDKLVELSGKVSDITASTITFEGAGSILVVCRHSDERVSNIQKNQRATVRGRSNGLSMGVYATLTDCRLT